MWLHLLEWNYISVKKKNVMLNCITFIRIVCVMLEYRNRHFLAQVQLNQFWCLWFAYSRTSLHVENYIFKLKRKFSIATKMLSG